MKDLYRQMKESNTYIVINDSLLFAEDGDVVNKSGGKGYRVVSN